MQHVFTEEAVASPTAEARENDMCKVAAPSQTEAFLRRGYQRMTWWEEDKDREEKSDDWRR